MSSDGYFDDELDSAFLNEVDAIEAAHVSPPKRHIPTLTKPFMNASPQKREVIEINDSDDEYGVSLFNDDALQAFDQICAAHDTQPSTSTKPASRKSTMGTVQTTLFGQVVSGEPSSSKAGPSSSRKPMSKTTSNARNPFANRPKKTKQWDHAAFAKTGWRKPKGKAKASFDAEGEEEEDLDDPVEFEQFPAPPAAINPPPPMKLKPDLLAARRWIYPLNKPKRDYQFNIVKHCLYENTLVAIPTGLGKTFIAGVVMLNFYTWFPEGKVVFVAPTRPLVAQQIEACHQTCGIPGSHAVELTGNNARTMRAKAWQEQRVFYMTPQTLMNDLRTDNCDPRDIVLLVVDEAHKGTGDYAYAQVVRFLMAKNSHFRLLALTATPGSTPEAVQAVVDSLHISHVEIRDEESLDLRRYMHEKRVEQHVIRMNEDIVGISDLLAAIMQPLIKQLQGASIIRGHVDAKTLHPYRCQAAMKELSARRDSQPWAYKPLSTLGSLARAMGYLYEGSMGMCYTSLKGLTDDGKDSGKKQTKLQKDDKFQALMQEMVLQRARGFTMHPKKEKMLDLIIQHFGTRMPDENGEEVTGSDSSRVMVFSTFRENVDELVEMLNEHKPLIRAVRFIGQGTDKQGRKGYAQKEQMEVIKKFKAGEYNVLVSTSVGEEGLDIGEVDTIICYESQKTPIRMLQRIGRTGRKKDGVVHVLLAEGREDRNWDKAKENYQQVQHFIVRADQLELYDDVSRLLPDYIKPECIEMVMDIEEYNREEATSKKFSAKSPTTKAAKRKRNDDAMRNIPNGASTGFVSVKNLLAKAKPKKTKSIPEFDPLACEEDDDDRAILDGLDGPRRTTSLSATSKSTKAKKPRRATTIAVTGDSKAKSVKSRKKKTEAAATTEMSGSQLDKLVADDSDDLEIKGGLFGTEEPYVPLKPAADPNPRTPSSSPSRRNAKASLLLRWSSSPDVPIKDKIIDLTTPDVAVRPPSPSPPEVPSSLSRAVSTSRSVTSASDFNVGRLSRSLSARSRTPDKCDADTSMAWLIEDDEELDIQFQTSSPASKASSSKAGVCFGADDADASIEFVDDYIPPSPSRRQRNRARSPPPKRRPSPSQLSQEDMPPPALPSRFTPHSPGQSHEMPPPTFAVRAPGKQARKRTILATIESSPLVIDDPSETRFQRHRSKSPSQSPELGPPRKKKRKFKDASEAQKHNPWIELEANHSGDDRSVGTSGPEDNMDEYDRSFVQDLPETQVSPSYDQTAVYRQSLLSQAPGRSNLPAFASRPTRQGSGLRAAAGPSRQRYVDASSPRRTDEEPDEYAFGSFVVDDDDEVTYIRHSSSDF